MSDYTTCAVYYRMSIGAMKNRGNVQALEAEEREKMNVLIAKAKEVGIDEFGDEAFMEEMFQDEWEAVLAEMTDQINRNYANFSRIKYKYKNRCEAMLAGLGG